LLIFTGLWSGLCVEKVSYVSSPLSLVEIYGSQALKM